MGNEFTYAQYGKGTTAGRYVLVCNSVSVGDWVNDFKTDYKLVTPVQVRHNFWASYPVLDGSFPAIVWEHSFTVYHSATNYKGFIDWYYNLFNIYQAQPAQLSLYDEALNTGSSTLAAPVCIDFGACYLQDGPRLKQPEALLMYAAGMAEVKFIGSVQPIVDASTI